ncbi:aminoglycoside phosphotransferase [Streptomyces sp. NPDC093510]|uniref:aminoglycoside phosphotransferase n=1 Tax=Streptomyces sp. NPDC093510 TaxID=3155199 RepID=UPI0034412DC8
MPSNAVPDPAVLDAFGVKGSRVPLVGGQGRSVLVGECVFKPAEGPADEIEWAASLFEELGASSSGFRVPLPLRAADGRSVVDGWTASEFVTGQPGPQGRWTGVLDAGRAFPVEQDAAQLIHGDLTGNVLFAAGQAPAVIDFSPYWRPPVYAEAVVIADGLLWFDLPSDLLTAAGNHPDWPQLLVRALIFRLVAHSENARSLGRAPSGEAERYARAADVVARKLLYRTRARTRTRTRTRTVPDQ